MKYLYCPAYPYFCISVHICVYLWRPYIHVVVIHSCGMFSSHLDIILFLDTSLIIDNGIKTVLCFKCTYYILIVLVENVIQVSSSFRLSTLP